MNTTNRILYIDNLRIFLMALVVLHHLSITYGASGGWYYKEVEGDSLTQLILTMFAASNQSFFMGLFFLLSAYFTRISLHKKSMGTFIRDRLLRLGIPLVVYFFLISPATVFVVLKYTQDLELSFPEFVWQHQGFGVGPLWFVETLIYFSIVYLLIHHFFNRGTNRSSQKIPFPSTIQILGAALGISLVSFIVRLEFPLGSSLGETGLQLPYFPQYIAFMIFGILIQKNNWFEVITFKMGIRWFVVAQVLILITFPLVFLTVNNDQNQFEGGFTWQSALLCLWEQLTGFSLTIGLVGIFKQLLNRQGRIARVLSGAAYTVFIIHPLVVVSLSIVLRTWSVYPVVKFVALAPLALAACFGIGILIKKIPVVSRIV